MLGFSEVAHGPQCRLGRFSVISAIFCGAGWRYAVHLDNLRAALGGGAISRWGIAAMHYTGMAAFESRETDSWDRLRSWINSAEGV